MLDNPEIQKKTNRQIARCIASISQVITPHEIVIDSIKVYMNYLAKDIDHFHNNKSIIKNSNVIKKYEHKRFDSDGNK